MLLVSLSASSSSLGSITRREGRCGVFYERTRKMKHRHLRLAAHLSSCTFSCCVWSFQNSIRWNGREGGTCRLNGGKEDLFQYGERISSENAASPSAISLPQIAHQRWSRLGRPAPGMSGPEGETDLSGASERPRSFSGWEARSAQ